MADIPNDLTSLFNSIYPGGASQSSIYASAPPSDPGTVTAQAAAPAASGGDPNAGWAEIAGYNRWALKQNLAQQKKALDFQYAQMRQQAKTASQRLELDRWYERHQIDLLQQTHDLDVVKQEAQVNQFGQTLAEQQRQFNNTMGYNILNTGVQYAQKPADYVMASQFAQGIANNPNFSTAVNGLLTGENARLFGQAGGAPQAANLGGLAGMYGGAAGAPQGTTAADQLASGASASSTDGAYDINARAQRAQSLINAGSQLTQRGGGSLGPQALESLDPMTLGLAQSGVQGAGGDWGTLMQQYRNSRVQQGTSSKML